MNRDFWARRHPWLVATGVAAVVLTTLRPGAKAPIDVLLALAGLFVALQGLRPRRSLGEVARQLAAVVVEDRRRFQHQALAETANPKPADLEFEPALGRWRSDSPALPRWWRRRWWRRGGTADGTLSTIAAYYRQLPLGRLVILGEPGSGKTVLATQLVLDLVESLPAGDVQPAAKPQVPVWLSLPSCQLGEPASLAEVSGYNLAARLDAWITGQLVKVFGRNRADAHQLVSERWVLPVLDGLDEMDSVAAEAVVRALNATARPVVLVSRRAQYDALASRGKRQVGQVPVLQDAQHIVLQPLTPYAIVEYLTYRFSDPDGNLESRWHPVRDELLAPRGADSVATLFGTPWRLYLLVSAYDDSSTDPGEVIRPGPDRVQDKVLELLMCKLIPAVIRRTPRRRDDHEQDKEEACRVKNWLRTLANHLVWQREHGSSGDLDLATTWRMAGSRAPRYLHAAVVIVPFIIGIGIFAQVTSQTGTVVAFLQDPLSTPPEVLIGGVPFVLAPIVLLLVSARGSPHLRRGNYRRLIYPTRRDLSNLILGSGLGLALGVPLGVVLGLTVGLTFGSSVGLATGITTACATGLAVGLAAVIREDPRAPDRPSALVRDDLAYWSTWALAFGATLGATFGLAIERTVGSGIGLQLGLPFGLAFGLALAFGVVLTYAAWPWLALANLLVARRGALPPRLIAFLDWAYGAGLLRLSGTLLQFRHVSFQEWLHTQPSSVGTTSDVAGHRPCPSGRGIAGAIGR